MGNVRHDSDDFHDSDDSCGPGGSFDGTGDSSPGAHADSLRRSPDTVSSGTSSSGTSGAGRTPHRDGNHTNDEAARKDRVFCTGWTDDETEPDVENVKENPWPLAERAMNPDAASVPGPDSSGSDEERTIRQAKIDRERIRTSAEREVDQILKDRSTLSAKIADLRDQLESTPIPEWTRESEEIPAEQEMNETDTTEPVVNPEIGECEESTPEGGVEGSDRWSRILAAGPRIAAWVGGGFTALLAVVPSLIGVTSIPESRIQAMLPPTFRGTVNVGSSSLSWFSPIVLREVTLTGEENLPLGKVASIETDRSLTGLLFGSETDGMTVTLNQPDVTLLSAG
ncbi:MAG: hypothetical protein Q4C47_01450, partial [Planctomycetia bacterium]|nr:hypothetical protein [Planctomycetia bacterium]